MSETKKPSEQLRSPRADVGSVVENRPFPLLRPNPEKSLPGRLLLAAIVVGALAFWILAREKPPSSPGLLALACGAPALAGLAWMVRRRRFQGIFLLGQLLFTVLETTAWIRRAPFPLGAAPIVPAAMMLWGLAGMARRADELERRILVGALAAASAIAVSAMLAYGLAETLGAVRAPAVAWFEVHVLALYAGLVIVSRRYN